MGLSTGQLPSSTYSDPLGYGAIENALVPRNLPLECHANCLSLSPPVTLAFKDMELSTPAISFDLVEHLNGLVHRHHGV